MEDSVMLIMDEVRRLVEEKIKAHERRLHAAAERRMRASEVSFHISEEQIAGGGAACYSNIVRDYRSGGFSVAAGNSPIL